MQKKGIVYLVGAGPGDPGLITVKGVACLKKAEVVVYDYLANKSLLQLSPKKTEFVYVGKKGASHTQGQDAINSLLIKRARAGRTVVRLKGGDPYVFGRGGEEAEALAEEGVPFEVVPGVTSAIAVPAYAGIPVTHRDFTSAVTFVTGHEKDEEGASPLDWDALAKIGTLVFLMAYANLSHIVQKLLEAGLDPETPSAMIEWGTLPRQKTAFGNLKNIVETIKGAGLRPPTVLIVGRVVSLKSKIDWFSKKPLLGKRIVVTRARTQAGDLSKRLEDLGAEVIGVPTIEIKPPASWKGLDRAIFRIADYDWLVFTSVNGVTMFFDRLKAKGGDLRDMKGVRIAAVGPTTARAVEDRGLRVDCVAKEFQAEGLVKALARKKVAGKRFLLCRAKEGREVLIDGLKRLKARVDLVEAYRTTLPDAGARRSMRLPDADLVTFASSAMVENFIKIFGPCTIPVAAIGPITTATAKKRGLNVVVQAPRSTIDSLVDAIVLKLGHKGNPV